MFVVLGKGFEDLGVVGGDLGVEELWLDGILADIEENWRDGPITIIKRPNPPNPRTTTPTTTIHPHPQRLTTKIKPLIIHHNPPKNVIIKHQFTSLTLIAQKVTRIAA